MELAEALTIDLLELARAHSKFESFPGDRIAASATLLVRYGLDSLGAFRTTDEISRRYLFEDLRKTEQLNFLQLSFLLKLARHILPRDQKLSEKNMRFTDLDIPRELAAYHPVLSNLSSMLLPDQEMANFTQKEIAIAAAKDPPYVPFWPRSFLKRPGYLRILITKRLARAGLVIPKQARRSLIPQELSIRAFTLYHLRFAIASDLCKAWSTFGGLGPQLSHLSTILHLAITESVGVALAYHRLVSTKLTEKARKRPTQASDFTAASHRKLHLGGTSQEGGEFSYRNGPSYARPP